MSIASRLLRIDPVEATFDRRGFEAPPGPARDRLEGAGRAFLRGYHVVLDGPGSAEMASRLDAVDDFGRGFAYEGAGMALSLLDRLTPWRRDRIPAFLAGPGRRHRYTVHVGIGWALARLRIGVRGVLHRLDPLLRWLCLDGYGFHEGYFRTGRAVGDRRVPGSLSGYALRAFDQGLGRSLWFARAADVERVAAAVYRFEPSRRRDLWSGIGLAAAYAGPLSAAGAEALDALAGAHRVHAAQGVAFAAKARDLASATLGCTRRACRALCGMSPREAAALTDDALPAAPGPGAGEGYELWRRRIRSRLRRRRRRVA